ncbi:hypothetical protein AB0G49_14220 [Streptomyces longwoodensis]|uniref:hypothetical protein n=1 Tax=Streptomyces longwoodensis TaxID=68231 RepID=UPI0033ED9206
MTLALSPVTPQPSTERRSIQLFTVADTSHGPYVGLPVDSLWTPYSGHLFTRATAEQIVKDLHEDECHMYAEFGEDGTLTFEWTVENDGEGGTKTITPDQHGRYLIGDLWEWEDWRENPEEHSAYQRLYALGASEYRQADRSSLMDPAAAVVYAMGRVEAHTLTLHQDDTPENALGAVLRPYGVTGERDDDCANSWLVFPYALDDSEFDGSGPHVVAYVSVEGQEEVFVDEIVGARRGQWHVRTARDAGKETEVLSLPVEKTERVAGFIADLLTMP